MYFGASYGKYTPVDIMLTHRLNQSSLAGMRHRGGFDIPLVIGFLPPRQRVPFVSISQQGALTPIGDVRAKVTAVPLDSQMRFERSTHKWKMVCGHLFQNAKIPRTSSCKKMKFWEFFQQSILAPPFSVSRSPPSGWCIPCRSRWKASESGPWPPAGSQWGSKKYMNMKHLEAIEQEPQVG